MELWDWNTVQHNRWARAAKACNQVGVRPMWSVEEQEEDTKKLSWAAATRPLRRLKARIVSARESIHRSKHGCWTMLHPKGDHGLAPQGTYLHCFCLHKVQRLQTAPAGSAGVVQGSLVQPPLPEAGIPDCHGLLGGRDTSKGVLGGCGGCWE
jgi:hypothetical protein